MDSSELTRRSYVSQRILAPLIFLGKWIGIVMCLLLVGLLGTQLRAQNPIQFGYGGNQQVAHGDTLEIPLIAQNLENLQSIQFNIHFNPHIIDFLNLNSLDTTSGIFPSNIGLSEAGEGRIFFVAVATDAPIELADGDTLCILSFQATGTPGSTTLFGVQGYPLELQAFNGSAFVPFSATNNFVSITSPPEAGYTVSVCPNIDSSSLYDVQINFFGDTIAYDVSLVQTSTSDTLFQEQIHPDSNITLSGLTPATYLIELVSPLDSTILSDSLLISEKEELIPTFFTTAATCPQIPDGRIELPFIEGGHPPYTVLWPDSTLHFRNFEQLIPDIYELAIIDQDRCSYLFDIEVEGPEAIVQEIVEPASCETAQDGNITSNVLNLDRFEDSTLLFSLNSNDWFRTEFLQVISLPAGPFTYYIQDTSGCIYTQEVLIPFDNTIQLENINQVDPRCFGTNDGLVSATARLDIVRPGNFIFDWSGPNPSAMDSFFLAVGLSPDSFTLEVTHTSLPESCFDRETIVLEDTDSLILNVNSQSESCFGQHDGFISITPQGGNPPFSYNWTDNATDSLRDDLPPGMYEVEVNDANFCSQSAVVTIDTGFLLSWENIEISDVDCPDQNNGQILFQIDTQYRSNIALNYFLSPLGKDTLALETLEASILNLPGDTYDLSVISSPGCRLDTTLGLSEPGPIIIDSFGIISGDCNQANAEIFLSLQGGNGGPFQFNWSNGTVGSPLDSVVNGQYMVTVTDSAACVDSFTFDIPNPPAPEIDGFQTQQPLCFSDTTGSITLQFDTAAMYTFNWNTGATSPILENIPAGLYLVTVSSVRNCTDTLTIEVLQPDSIQISFETQPASSGQSDGEARAIVSGGTPPYTFFWNTTPIQTDSVADNLPAGAYEVLIIDANNCRASDRVNIDETTSVSEFETENQITLWPNPSSGRFYLKRNNASNARPISVEIRDMIGKLLSSQPWPESQTPLEVNLSSSGLYYVHVLYHNGVRKVIPVIVQQ